MLRSVQNCLRPGTERLNSNDHGRTYSRETRFVNGVALCHGNGRFDLFHENAQSPQNRAATLLETRHDRAEVTTAPPAIHRCVQGKGRPACGHQKDNLAQTALALGIGVTLWWRFAAHHEEGRYDAVRQHLETGSCEACG